MKTENLSNWLRTIAVTAMLGFGIATMTGCATDGAFEEAGEEIDEAAEEVDEEF